MAAESSQSSQSAGLMGMLGGLYSQNDVATKEIFAILNSFVSGNRCQNLLVNMAKSSCRVILIIVINHYISKSGDLITLGKQLGWYVLSLCLYRKRSYALKGSGVEPIAGTRLSKLNAEGEMVHGFPIYMAKTDDEVTITYAKGIHSKYLETIATTASLEYEQTQSPNAILYQWDVSGYVPHVATTLFPSRNFLNLQNIVEKHILATRLLGNYNVVGILIDGEPGLGKSMAVHYLASQNSVRILRRIDLSSLQCLRTPAEKLINDCYHKTPITQSTMFMFDEIDKWLEFQIQNTYSAIVNKKPAPTQEGGAKTEGGERGEGERNVGSNSAAPVIPTFEEHSRGFRVNFLYLLLSILERTGQNNSVMVVFCSNNFDSIFGDIDMTHFRSLKDRFQKLTFYRCQREEVAGYLRFNNSKFAGTPLHVPDLEPILARIPTVGITYRKLNELAVLNAYDPERIIGGLLTYHSEPSSPVSPISSSSSSPSPSSSSSSPSSSSPLPLMIFSSMAVGFSPVIPKKPPGGGFNSWKCGCEMRSFVVCECIACESQDKQCHWCVTGDERWAACEDLPSYDEAYLRIGELSRELSDTPRQEGRTTIYLQILEHLNQDPNMLAIREANLNGKAGAYVTNAWNQIADNGANGRYDFFNNLLLFDSVLRKLTQPLPKAS